MSKPLLYKSHMSLVGLLFCLLYGPVHAQTPAVLVQPTGHAGESIELENTAVDIPVLAPERNDIYELTQLAQDDSYKLLGIDNTQQLEFTVRRDQLINKQLS